MKWSDMFEDYKILTDADKVRKNSRDDFGLGYGWYFVGGSYVPGKTPTTPVWTVVYAKPREEIREEVEPHMCEGRIGSSQLHFWPKDNTWRVVFGDSHMIAQHRWPEEVTEIPEDILDLLAEKEEEDAETEVSGH